MAESEQQNVDNEFPVDEALKFLEGTAPFIMGKGMAPHVFSNEPYNPVPYGLLDILYTQVFENNVGIAMCREDGTDAVVPVLCFLANKNQDDVELFPIAKLFTETEALNYRAPVGNGEYFERADTEQA